MTYDDLWTVDIYEFHQEIREQGVVPFVLREDNTIFGEGTWPTAPCITVMIWPAGD